MKNKGIKLIVSVCALSACTFANTICQKASGELVCHSGEVSVINTSGVFRADGTQIKKKLSVKGQAIIKNAQINDMKITGGIAMATSSVLGQANVNGFLSVRDSKFNKVITVFGNFIQAEATKFEDMIINSSEQTARVNLQDKSIVNGNVIFKGKPGIVALASGAKVLGKIINGKQV